MISVALLGPSRQGRIWSRVAPPRGPLHTIEAAVPFHEPFHACLEGGLRRKTDVAGEIIDVGIGRRHVPRLHRREPLDRLAAGAALPALYQAHHALGPTAP